MKFDQLVYFLEAARHQHIGKAAKVLAISPSAISHTVAALEEQLGHSLFEKQGKRIYLTDHGRRLAERAEEILRDVEQLRDELSAEHVEWTGVYRVAATHGLSGKLLAPAWAELTRRHAGLSLQLYSLRSAEIVQQVAAGEVDLGICYSPLPDPRLNSTILHQDALVLATRAGHPLLKHAPADRFKHAQKFPCAAPKAMQGIENCEAHPALKAHGITPDVRFVFDSYEVAVEYLAGSDAWALLPAWFVRESGRRLRATEFPENPTVEIAAVSPLNRWVPRALRGLLDDLSARLGANTVH